MKRLPSSLLLLISIVLLSSFDKETLVNQRMPFLTNKTLEGRSIDSNYYKGHVTIVSFMYIGCPPCMNEINTLNKIKADYSNNEQLQVLCIARQMENQMVEFNGDNSSIFSKIRSAFGAEPIKYSIQPGCNSGTSKMEVSADDVRIKSECSTIEDVYGITSYPTIMYVDGKGIVRKIDVGGPGKMNDSSFYNKIRAEIEVLLAEQKK